MADDTNNAGAGGDQGQSGSGQDAAHWQAEAKKAFDARQAAKKEADDLRKQLDALKGVDPEEYKALKQQAEKAEDERKRKAGEFDAWRADILKKHDEEKAAEQDRAAKAEAKYRAKLVGLEFASASSLFGETGKTVLTPEIAEAYFGRYVEVQEIDGRDVVVVKGPDGHVILNTKTGKPAAFADAMADVLETLPNKTQILRGSGKTGSGSSGGSTGTTTGVDLTRLKSSDFSNPAVQQALKDQAAKAGGLQFGRAWDRVAK